MRAFLVHLALFTIALGNTCDIEASDALVGKRLPCLETESLLGETLVFPRGHQHLLIVGFSRECCPKVCEWVREVRRQRVLPPSVEFFTIPVCGDSFAMRLFRPIIIGHIKQQAPEKEHGRIALYFGDEEKLMEFLKVPRECLDPVLLLVDQDGTILWHHRGAPGSNALESLKLATRTESG